MFDSRILVNTIPRAENTYTRSSLGQLRQPLVRDTNAHELFFVLCVHNNPFVPSSFGRDKETKRLNEKTQMKID